MATLIRIGETGINLDHIVRWWDNGHSLALLDVTGERCTFENASADAVRRALQNNSIDYTGETPHAD